VDHPGLRILKSRQQKKGESVRKRKKIQKLHRPRGKAANKRIKGGDYPKKLTPQPHSSRSRKLNGTEKDKVKTKEPRKVGCKEARTRGKGKNREKKKREIPGKTANEAVRS